uniref:Uncharacterized protein AlNc14C78G5172 n=1 Tax=Albugo laibachii Nc14 TaxID=890382 RepID=F0WEX4_9STRA|nr:conserved hypothetical protein [Albugo laibachii Nc14]|eukprot:CCA19756.1 conserved hypothetical protein [Albugo laibachii Nc14]
MSIYTVDNDEVLFYIINFLHANGFFRSAFVLMDESGIDPFWLCGISKEMTLLRQSILTGDYNTTLKFVHCLEGSLPAEEFEYVSKMLRKEQLLERLYDLKGSTELQLVNERKNEALDELRDEGMLTDEQLIQWSSWVTPIEEYWLETPSSHVPLSTWSPHESRLACYERVLSLFRPEIITSDAEYVYKMMPKLELAYLLDEALRNRGSTKYEAASIAALNSLRIAPIELSSSSMKLTEERPDTLFDYQHQLTNSVPLTQSVALKPSSVAFPEVLKHHPLVMSIQFDRQWEGSRDSLYEEKMEDPPIIEPIDVSIQTLPLVKNLESVNVAIQASSMVKLHAASSQTENSTSDAILQTDVEPLVAKAEKSIQISWEHEHPVSPTTTASENENQKCRRIFNSINNELVPANAKLSDLNDVSTHENNQGSCLQCPHKAETVAGLPPTQEPAYLTYDRLGVDHIVQAHVVAEVKEAHAVRAMDVSITRAEAMIGTNARTLRIFDLGTIPLSRFGGYEETKALPLLPVILEKYRHHSLPIYSVAYNHFANDLWIASGSVDSSIRLVNLNKQDDIRINEHLGKVRCLAFAQSHLLFSAASRDFVVRCWNFEYQPQACCQRFDGHVGEIVAMQFPPSYKLANRHTNSISTHFLTASMDKTIRNWDLRTSQCTQLVASTRSVAYALAFNPQASQILASAHQDGSISLWDLRMARRALQSLSHHRDECRCISWSPDGNWLVSGSFDETVCLFSASHTTPLLAPIASFHQHTGKVLQIQWNPHMPSFLTTGADHCVKLWTF